VLAGLALPQLAQGGIRRRGGLALAPPTALLGHPVHRPGGFGGVEAQIAQQRGDVRAALGERPQGLHRNPVGLPQPGAGVPDEPDPELVGQACRASAWVSLSTAGAWRIRSRPPAATVCLPRRQVRHLRPRGAGQHPHDAPLSPLWPRSGREQRDPVQRTVLTPSVGSARMGLRVALLGQRPRAAVTLSRYGYCRVMSEQPPLANMITIGARDFSQLRAF
jgi:hypothetical protein